MMQKIRACIFDLDGTLADTLQDLTGSLNRALASCGYQKSYEEDVVKGMVGNGIRKLVDRALAPHGEGAVDSCLAAFLRDYETHCLDAARPYDGLPHMIKTLRGMGVKTAVISNKADMLAKKIVAALYGDRAFDIVQGMRPDILPKPAPDAALAVMKSLSVLPEECAIIGDSGVDMQTAVNAGTRAIGVTWGFRGREELLAAGADVLVEDAAQLLACLGGSQTRPE